MQKVVIVNLGGLAWHPAPARTPDIRVWFMANWADSSMAELRGVERTAPL